MANVTQHEAAELWEMVRDHHLLAAKMQWLAQSVQDASLRQTLQHNAQRCQQAAQQLDGFLHQAMAPGQQAQAHGFGQAWPGNQHTYLGGQSGYAAGQQGAHAIDIFAAGECLKECKAMAVKCMWGATEASQPARGFLQQLAGEHLHMAEQYYRWLEQRGLYASPKADPQAIQTYNQKLHQIAQAGQQVAQQAPAVLAASQAYHSTTAPAAYGQSQFGQQYGQQYAQQYGQYQPVHQSQHGQNQWGQQQYGQPYQYEQQSAYAPAPPRH